LKIIDIPEGEKPRIPPTWPGVPLLTDSPDHATTFTGDTVEVSIRVTLISGIAGASFDGLRQASRPTASCPDSRRIGDLWIYVRAGNAR
jgi:hypothetical protein